jgi:transcription elongation factor SPT6
MAIGQTPSVVAITCGRGNKDAVLAVHLSEKGRVVQQLKLDDVFDPQNREQLVELLSNRKPDVVVIGGFTLETHPLRLGLKKILREMAGAAEPNQEDFDTSTGFRDAGNEALLENEIPLIYVHDAVARIYMNSTQSKEEHPSWPTNARYALALARYAQDPLKEYCNLGADVTAVHFNDWQRYVSGLANGEPFLHDLTALHVQVSPDKLLIHLERALVTVVNGVGVDIGSALGDPYLQKMLPFLAGMGPRKVERLLKGIQRAVSNKIRPSTRVSA